jgi:hypothetical protein
MPEQPTSAIRNMKAGHRLVMTCLLINDLAFKADATVSCLSSLFSQQDDLP